MKSHLFLTLSLLVSACQSLAQNPAYSPIEIKINSDSIRWVQSVPPTTKANNSSAGNTFGNLNANTNSNLDFSSVPKGFLGIGLNTNQNMYGFISEEVVVTLQSKAAASDLAKLNANCKLIVENLQMYVCKASSVPHLQSLVTQLQAIPTVKQASPQFITNFKQPM
jgi:hypothetical protein